MEKRDRTTNAGRKDSACVAPPVCFVHVFFFHQEKPSSFEFLYINSLKEIMKKGSNFQAFFVSECKNPFNSLYQTIHISNCSETIVIRFRKQ